MCFFFFSSRRRHTRSKRDWSSDVCSYDLGGEAAGLRIKRDDLAFPLGAQKIPGGFKLARVHKVCVVPHEVKRSADIHRSEERRVAKHRQTQIRRASVRERVQSTVAVLTGV